MSEKHLQNAMSKPVNSRADLLGFPKSYAFVIGINNYPKINANLKSAVNDARALAIALKYRQGFDHVELLIDPHPEEDQERLQNGLENIEVNVCADGDNFRNLLERIQDPAQAPRINPQDCIVFYYAGHGKPGAFEEGPRGYLLPSDAQPEMAMLKNDSLIAMEAVFETLKKLDCHHTLLILDCCFAGKFRYTDDSRMGRIGMSNMPLYPERFERYKREKAWQVIVSAGPHQTAADWLGERQELSNGIHSPFAEALLEALEGKAELASAEKRRGDGVLTAQELFLYLWNKVEKLTKDGHLGDKSQYPDLFPMANHQGGQFIFFDPNNKLNFANRVLRNPYQGLKPFEISESDLFFGRKIVIKNLLPRLLEQPLLVITAPSGSGKSSLVKAGLFPALTNWQSKTGEKPWAEADLFVLHPGSKPWTGEKQDTWEETDSQKNVYPGLKSLLPQLQKDKKQVLLLDQYEELFTDGATEPEKDIFEQELIKLHQTAKDHQLKIIITLRSDYEWMLEESAFGQSFWGPNKLSRFLYRLPNMRIDELREALVNPALAELYEFETENLVETILAEIGNAPGALPMLSFTMSQFYEATDKDTRVFTQDIYQALGGINGALSKYADGVYEALPPDQQEVMQRLILRMVKVNNGSYGRRRVYNQPSNNFLSHRGRSFLNEFDYSDTQDAIVTKVLKHLEDKQLILGGKDFIGSYYIPVHDSLIQHWKMAKQWINDFGAENINLQRQLWQAVLDSSRTQIPQSTYQALPEDGLGVDDQLTSNFSKLWDANPKLLQILEQVSNAAKDFLLANKEAILTEALPQIGSSDKENFTNFFDDCHAKGRVPDLNSLILSGYSDKFLSLFLDKGNHWLNQAETNFIQQSWEKRIGDIVDLKQQRDEALALVMTSRAQTLSRADKATALRIAQVAWDKTPQPLPEAKYAIAGAFYSQLGTPRQPLPNVGFIGHAKWVNSAVFSPDGNQILTASGDHTAKLWTIKGELITTFAGHTDGVYSAIFSPDGTQVITISRDHTAKLWTTQGALMADLVGHNGQIYSTAFSPDGSQIFTASGNNTAKIWTNQGKLITNLLGCAGVFSPDGCQVLTKYGDEVRLWKTNGELIVNFVVHTEMINSAVFSPDGSQILTASDDRTAKLWDTQGKLIANFEGHKNFVHSALFSPNGTQVLTISRGYTAKLWTTQGELIADLVGHTNGIRSAVFSPDGTQILTASRDQTAKIWNTKGELITDLVGHVEMVNSAIFSPDGSQILTASQDQTAKLWTKQVALITDFVDHTDHVAAAVFLLDGTHILTVSDDRTAKIWNTKGELITDIVDHEHGIYSATLSPDGSQILTTSKDQTAKLLDIQGRLITSFVSHTKMITSAVFSPSGTHILTASRDQTAKLWNTQGVLITDFIGHRDFVHSAVFSSDNSQILTASYDQTAKLWNTQGGLIADFVGHSGFVRLAVFSPNGSQVLTMAQDQTAKVWNTQGELIADLVGHRDFLTSAVFSPDGSQILTTSRDQTAKLWNVQGELITTLVGHRDVVNSAVFLPDGSQILTASEDQTAKIWNAQGELIANLIGHTNGVNFAVFSPDGSQVLTASGDNTAKLWPTPERIYNYLKNESLIAELTAEQRKTYRIY